MFRFIGKFIVTVLASLGLMTLLLISSLIYLAFVLDDIRAPNISAPDNIVLNIDLDEGLIEGSGGRRIEGLSLRTPSTLHDTVVAIRNAADDPRVLALKANLSQQAMGLAQIQDIRDAVAEFRATGKPTVLFSETIGEGVSAMPAYYLASSFGEIWVQPSGTVGVAGIGAEQIFLKDFLDKLGVQGSFIQRKEYKSAGEMFTNSEMSPANREATEALLRSWYDQIVAGIANTRDLPRDAVVDLIDRGPLLSNEALDGGLIDQIGYRDEFEAAFDTTIGDADNLSIGQYLAIGGPEDQPEPEKHIALIHAVGEISRGGTDSALFPSDGIHSAQMSNAIREAAEDNDVDALLIRVDSPGGSYVASDIIWREVKKAKATSKPVIVSMGNAAASGGYFISMPADRIFAQPATVTGSIGVLLGKMVIGEAADKLGVNFERITFGESAGMFSSTTNFSQRERARLDQMLDATYEDFTSKAAEGRDMSLEEIDAVARGRVWSGIDAMEAGLVDEIGGLGAAIDYTKTQIGLDPDDPVWLVPFPPPEDPFRSLLRALENGQIPFGIFNLVRASAWLNQTLAPVLGEFSAAQRQGVQLYMPPVRAK